MTHLPCAKFNRLCWGCQALKRNFPAALWRRWYWLSLLDTTKREP
jgi:hypothetical protein